MMAENKTSSSGPTLHPHQYCVVCDVPFTGPESALQHHLGKKHKNMQTRLEIVGVKPLSKDESDAVDQLKKVTEEMQRFSGGLKCEVCAVTYTSPQHMQQHLAGNPHKKAVRKQERLSGNVGICSIEQPILGRVGTGLAPDVPRPLHPPLLSPYQHHTQPANTCASLGATCHDTTKAQLLRHVDIYESDDPFKLRSSHLARPKRRDEDVKVHKQNKCDKELDSAVEDHFNSQGCNIPKASKKVILTPQQHVLGDMELHRLEEEIERLALLSADKADQTDASMRGLFH